MQRQAVRKVQPAFALAMPPAIKRVPHDLESEGAEMHPNLMGPPGEKSHLEPARPPSGGPDHPVEGARRLASRNHRHAFPVPGITADRRIDFTRAQRRAAKHHGVIGPLHRVDTKLTREPNVGAIRLRHHHDPGNISIETVNDAGPQHPADAGEGAGAVREEGIHECAARVARGRMDHETCRLLDHEEILVFVQHLERDRLGRGAGRTGIREPHLEVLAGSHFGRRLMDRGPVTPDGALDDQRLQARPRHVLEASGEEAVDTLASLVRLGNDGDRFRHGGKVAMGSVLLKAFVIGAGVVLVAGTLVLAALLIQRALSGGESDVDRVADPPQAPRATSIALPPGGEIETLQPAGEQVLLLGRDEAGQFLLVIDPLSGERLNLIRFRAEAPSSASGRP